MPGTRLDRPAIAFIGAALTLASGVTDLRRAAGSVANLIVVEQGRAHGAREVTFLEYLKVGVPVTVLTVAAGVLALTRR